MDGVISRRAVTRASVLFFLLGPGLEAGFAPWLLTGGWDHGADLPLQSAWTVLGAVLVAAGLSVVARAFVAFVVDGHGTPTPAAPTGRLVVSGVYRYVRNPMYVATAAAIVGEGLILARPLLFVGAGAYVVTLALATRRWEEPALRRRFGPRYDAYVEAVPGWWPRLRPWSP